jgi:hypothetical protein
MGNLITGQKSESPKTAVKVVPTDLIASKPE